MELIKSLKKVETGMEGEIYFALFERDIELVFDEDVSIEYVTKCVQKLNSLSEEAISAICNYSLDFCVDTMKNLPDVEYAKGLSDIKSNSDILQFIQPISLTVDAPDDENISAINLYCKCEWDEDNDMQILLQNDTVLYVGVFDGLDPWQHNLSEWGNYVTGYRL